MQLRSYLVICAWLICCSMANARGQGVELIYTKSGFDQAMSFKESLKTSNIDAFNALALNNISEEREAAYLGKIASMEASLIVGETAMKAAAAIDFPMPLIIIDALGAHAAKGPVFRVFESTFDASGATNVKTVSAVDGFALTADDVKNGKESMIKCQNVRGVDVVNKILTELARLRK